MDILPDGLQRAVTLAKEKGSSSWLTALPLAEHSFTLHKGAFHDALALRYSWTPPKLPAKCDCGSSFFSEHALTCVKGGFVHCRRNEIRDLTATLLTEVCKDVRVEPELQPVTHEVLNGATANSKDGARLDIAANSVWGGNFERTYFDVRVFNPHAPTNRHSQLSSCYRKHEREKKRAYEQRVREVEHATFTSDGSNRRSGQRGQRFLQKISLHARHKMGSLLQHHPMLATLSPRFLPATLLYPSHQRCQVIMWTPHQTPHGNRSDHLRNQHLSRLLSTYSHLICLYIYASSYSVYFTISERYKLCTRKRIHYVRTPYKIRSASLLRKRDCAERHCLILYKQQCHGFYYCTKSNIHTRSVF